MSGLHRYAPTPASYGALDLQRTSDFQAALLGMAGHDLRQPLQIIQSAYEWLGSRVAHTSEKARLQRGERAIARLTEQLGERLRDDARRDVGAATSAEADHNPDRLLRPVLCLES